MPLALRVGNAMGMATEQACRREAPAAREAAWEEPILAPGKNCWCIERADRFAFLVDAAAYFDALAASLEQVETRLLIIGWDIHTRTVLRPDGNGRGRELWAWLDDALKRKPKLEVHLLEWDFSVLYVLERDWRPILPGSAMLRRSRLHFRLDREQPWSATQHQKLVVFDGALAYVGGLDVTVHRWDTPEHRAVDPRRRLPSGRPYGPFHDVQIAVDGPAARALSRLAEERWECATKAALPPVAGKAPWPSQLHPDLVDVEVAIARTVPPRDGEPPIREVEALYLDAIAAARRVIYIETQYFTSASVTEALERRLAEADGPEVVLVLPERCSGWLEESTMGALRQGQLRRLARADHQHRLRAVAPFVKQGASGVGVIVHSKVLVIDERLVRVGSSNLCARSMGFDSECDLAVEAAHPGDRVSLAIAAFRNRLVGEHLGLEPSAVQRHLETEGSLISLIDRGGSSQRTLESIDFEGEDHQLVLDAALVDPQSPEAPGRVAERFFNDDVAGASRHPWIKAILVLAALLGLAAAWKWTPLGEWIQPERVAVLATQLQEHPLAPAIVVLAFVVGSLLMVPLTALVMATALTFGFWEAVCYSLVGASLGGVAGFGAGRWLGRDTVQRVMGSRLRRANELLARRGLLSVVTVRLIPIAPFTIANLVVGASQIRLRDFVLGSAIALLPGIVMINLFEMNLRAAISDPSWGTVVLVALIPLVAVLLLAVLRRALGNLEGNARGS